MDAYDSQIAQDVEDVSRILGLKITVKVLRWVDRVTRSKVNSDDCRFAFGLAAFPDRMKGRLEPKEWRPLLASTLIHRKILARNPPGSILVSMLALFVLMIVGVGILVAIFGYGTGVLPVFPYPVLLGGPVLVNVVNQGAKKHRLQADLEVARIFGKEDLLAALRKIDGLGRPDAAETENRG